MNEKETNTQNSIDEKRKKSLFHYIAVMFLVAFALVLISLLGQNKSLSLSKGVLQNAEQLQEENRQLHDQRVELTEELAQAKAELEQYKAMPLPEEVQKAYEMLLGDELDKLENYKQYLGTKGLEMYENLTKEGNTND